MLGMDRRARAWVLILLVCACLGSEQVLLLSEPGSGAHSFAASLASEARDLRGHDFVIAWDPCAVARRKRAASASADGTAASVAPFTARQCSDLVQRLLECSVSAADMEVVATATRLAAFDPKQAALASELASLLAGGSSSGGGSAVAGAEAARAHHAAACQAADVRMVKEGRYLSGSLLQRPATLVLHFLRDPRDLVLLRLRASSASAPGGGGSRGVGRDVPPPAVPRRAALRGSSSSSSSGRHSGSYGTARVNMHSSSVGGESNGAAIAPRKLSAPLISRTSSSEVLPMVDTQNSKSNAVRPTALQSEQGSARQARETGDAAERRGLESAERSDAAGKQSKAQPAERARGSGSLKPPRGNQGSPSRGAPHAPPTAMAWQQYFPQPPVAATQGDGGSSSSQYSVAAVAAAAPVIEGSTGVGGTAGDHPISEAFSGVIGSAPQRQQRRKLQSFWSSSSSPPLSGKTTKDQAAHASGPETNTAAAPILWSRLLQPQPVQAPEPGLPTPPAHATISISGGASGISGVGASSSQGSSASSSSSDLAAVTRHARAVCTQQRLTLQGLASLYHESKEHRPAWLDRKYHAVFAEELSREPERTMALSLAWLHGRWGKKRSSATANGFSHKGAPRKSSNDTSSSSIAENERPSSVASSQDGSTYQSSGGSSTSNGMSGRAKRRAKRESGAASGLPPLAELSGMTVTRRAVNRSSTTADASSWDNRRRRLSFSAQEQQRRLDTAGFVLSSSSSRSKTGSAKAGVGRTSGAGFDAVDWRWGLNPLQLSAVMRECSGVIASLRYPRHRWETAAPNAVNQPSLGPQNDWLGTGSSSSGSSTGSGSSGRDAPREPMRRHKQYPAAALAAYSDDRCGAFWLPIHGLGSTGSGSTSSSPCGEINPGGKTQPPLTLAVCGAKLKEAGEKCHAATFMAATPERASGRCILHDRASPTFAVKPMRGATHLVRSHASIDPCQSIKASSSTDFSSSSLPSEGGSGGHHVWGTSSGSASESKAGAILDHLRRFGFGNTTVPLSSLGTTTSGTGSSGSAGTSTSSTSNERFFFLAVTEDAESRARYPGLDATREMAECYAKESGGIQAWDEESRPDFAQNMAHVWAFESLRHSPLRTYDVKRASLVVLPLETALSSKLAKPCGGLATHAQRLQRLTTSVERWLIDHNPSMVSTQAQGTSNARDTTSSSSNSWGSWGGRGSASSGRRLLSNSKKKNIKKSESNKGGGSSSSGSTSGGRSTSGNGALDYRGPPVMVFGTYWATFRDWGGRAMRKHEMEPTSSSSTSESSGTSEGINATTFTSTRRQLLQQRHFLASSGSSGSWNSDASSEDATAPKQRKAPTLWQLLASHGILVTIDEYFSHDWGKVLVAPYLAHSDVTKQLLAGSDLRDAATAKANGAGGAAGGFLATKAANGAEYRDGRTLQLYFRGGVDHGSMCKRRRPVATSSFTSEDFSSRDGSGGSNSNSRDAGGGGGGGGAQRSRKRTAAELRDAANRGPDATTTWLREAAVQFFANAPPGVQFDGGGDRAKVYTRRRRLDAPTMSTATAQQPPQQHERLQQQLSRRFSEFQQQGSSNDAIADLSIVTIWQQQQQRLLQQHHHQRRRLASSHPAAHPPASYARAEYVAALLNSRFCLHLQGDTTTSRRLFDAIAAGCIPVIIADGVNLPFSSQLDWAKFSLQVPEAEVLAGHSPTLDTVMRRMHTPNEVAAMQHALAHARHDLLYGAGSPYNAQATATAAGTVAQPLLPPLSGGGAATRQSIKSPYSSPSFASRVMDHLLQEAFELASLPKGTRYRRFKPAFLKCLDLSLANT